MVLVLRSVKGANLTPAEVDGNFTDHEDRIAALESNPPEAVSIDHFSVVGNQLTVHMTDLSTKGPYKIPTATWTFRSEGWVAATPYAEMDLFFHLGSLYQVTWPHISQATFDPGANDGAGHPYYRELFSTPATYRTIGVFIPGKPWEFSCLARYAINESMQFPENLAGAVATSETAPAADISYDLYVTDTLVGTVNWAAGQTVGTFSFAAAADAVLGDSFQVWSNEVDADHADISITVRAQVT